MRKLKCALPAKSSAKSRGCDWRNYWDHEPDHHARAGYIVGTPRGGRASRAGNSKERRLAGNQQGSDGCGRTAAPFAGAGNVRGGNLPVDVRDERLFSRTENSRAVPANFHRVSSGRPEAASPHSAAAEPVRIFDVSRELKNGHQAGKKQLRQSARALVARSAPGRPARYTRTDGGDFVCGRFRGSAHEGRQPENIAEGHDEEYGVCAGAAVSGRFD